MIILSQNITNYDISTSEDSVLRINMAWCNSISELEEKLTKNSNSNFFIDLPIGRIKPPNNRYTLDEMIPILENKENVKFFAVSNVESADDLKEFLEKVPDRISIVPKIESPNGVLNIDEICTALKSKEKVVMLDHDDLFSNILKKKEDPESFQGYVKKLIEYCEKNNVSLLRTVGVVFSDDEKRTTQYIK
ncbi:hypothetical protein A7X95_05775 [Candidatus Nitrosopelagicus brevis]|uniref:Pyruvate kinase, barrel domain protein n=1 Tax=Candidatus Nitrosopelagicus brevis TaxID=1410606 RepID=A0A0A7V5C6_9ARCH|nr:pyruvate kinase [Candidatus Nitrosopelagicus brevis]AJA91900.1 pyruvate kinase, barrel domain protein [Candidatus Nitrosopelagicus brevis]MAR69784.1 hypothetical protein [Nitrospina sp.]PTL87400.1 hypothetical protein A7X95_05775 [Candidatus Nitrosopelagicus brevis]|tara:strand:+ start:1162 stop:1734 length:573 start_codon:yes stop_codon:yes gene_type:complete